MKFCLMTALITGNRQSSSRNRQNKNDYASKRQGLKFHNCGISKFVQMFIYMREESSQYL